jgi:geranylgeranyl pyrophosphate synthase
MVTISRLLAIINESGVLLECKRLAQDYIEKAIECLEKLECPGSK